MRNASFTIYCGPMMASKTSGLLMQLEKHKYQHKQIIAFKPSIDDRYASSDIVSHNGFRYPAISIKSGADIIEYLSRDDVSSPDVVAVDEAFMINGVADTLIYLYKLGTDVVVSTLDLSSQGKVFHEVEKMLPWATRVEKCTAVCTICGADARFTYKKHMNDREIEIGGIESYEPRCLIHAPFVHG